MLLAGDIGGTTVRLQLVSPERGPRRPLRHQEVLSAQFTGLKPAVEAFLADVGKRPDAACFSVAGPVVNGRAHLTNLAWDLEERQLAAELGLNRVDLVNDLACMGHALPHLEAEEFAVLSRGAPIPRTPIAVVAPGTGLGEAFLVWDGERYLVCPSEGGHCDFAPADPLQAELWAFLASRRPHVSVERVCSGSGLPDVYEFLRSKDPTAEPATLRAALETATNRTPLIVDAGLKDAADNPLADETLRLFVRVLAAEASNLALKVLATGGVYLAGGLPPRLLPLLREEPFMSTFAAKGRFQGLLEAIPVGVVTINAALLGAAIYGLNTSGRKPV